MKRNNERVNEWSVFLVLTILTAGLLYLIKLAGLSTDQQSGHQLNWLGQVLMLIVGMTTVTALGVLQLLLQGNRRGSESKRASGQTGPLSKAFFGNQHPQHFDESGEKIGKTKEAGRPDSKALKENDQ